MLAEKKSARILIAEDDDDYFALTEMIIKDDLADIELRRFSDGQELMDYLLSREKDTIPELILMDLNMPRKNGHEALAEIRNTPGLRKIPVVMLSVSTDMQDIIRSYELGANSFVTKPFDMNQLAGVFKTFKQYWFKSVRLPVG